MDARQAPGDLFHDGVQRGVVNRHLLEAIQRATNVGQDLITSGEITTARPLDAVQDAHRLRNWLGEVEKLDRGVSAALQSTQGQRELLARTLRQNVGGSQDLPPRLEGREATMVGSRESAVLVGRGPTEVGCHIEVHDHDERDVRAPSLGQTAFRAAILGALLSIAPPSEVEAAKTEKPASWASSYGGLEDRVESSGRLVVHVLVPLCDNAQIACGSTKAGDPDNLDHNLYWGAIFGQRRFFSRESSKFERVATEGKSGDRLERVVFRRSFNGEPWGRSKPVELIVVLDAYRGDAIDAALEDFFHEAERGRSVSFGRGEEKQVLAVDVVGWAGHNRMMDGKKPPARDAASKGAIPSFVMACRSSQYFAGPLSERGSKPILLTRDLMAPEGYVVHAIVTSLAENRSRTGVRARTVSAYATWQKIEERVAGSIFAKD